MVATGECWWEGRSRSTTTGLSSAREICGRRSSKLGKKIQACLKAAGAKASDIVLTRAYVTDADAFKQKADIRTEYLGPESPTSTVNTVPKLPAGPDYLIEIEAVANLNSATSASATPEQ